MTTTKTADHFKIIFATDMHNNHPKLDPVAMMGRFLRLMHRTIIKEKPDAIVFGGDWFDRPTSFTSRAGVAILNGMSTLIYWCDKYNIALRILQGTGSHDGSQNDNWVPLAAQYKNLDFALWKKIDVFTDWGFNILTIPDGVITAPHRIEAEVRRVMADKNLETVDLGFTHLMYTHHLENAGYIVDACDSDYYNALVEIMIMNGHIHMPSLVEKILTGGSTDRLRQGENHPKGIHVVNINRTTKKFTATFVEQEEAAIFNSYDVMEEDFSIAIERLHALLEPLDADDIYIRLHHRAGVSIRPIEEELRERFPRIVFDCVPNAKDVEAMKAKREMELTATIPEGIMPATVIPLMMDKFERSKMKWTQGHYDMLEEIKNAV